MLKSIPFFKELSSGHLHYALTEDAHPLMTRWGERTGFRIPSVSWFAKNHHLLRMKLEEILNRGQLTIIVDSHPFYHMVQEVRSMVYSHINKEIWFGQVISADPVYTPAIGCEYFSLGISRAVDVSGNDLAGRYPRRGSLSLEEQTVKFSKALEGCVSFNRNVLFIDDGIWTGETLKEAIRLLRSKNLNVVGAIIGIGANKFGRTIDVSLDNEKVEIVQKYEENSRKIEDWICERDFFFGVPFGGKMVLDDNLHLETGLPETSDISIFYPERRKKLKEWASVSDSDDGFLNFCLERSIALFNEVEKLSKKPVPVSAIERVPLFIAKSLAEKNVSPSERFVSLLESSRKD